jgi:DNA helicase-2/ATP-dependent DNA helicase PcrA
MAVDLKAGDRVIHSRFGEGTVTECLASNGDHEITIEFKEGVGVKRLLLSLAPLEKIL